MVRCDAHDLNMEISRAIFLKQLVRPKRPPLVRPNAHVPTSERFFVRAGKWANGNKAATRRKRGVRIATSCARLARLFMRGW